MLNLFERERFFYPMSVKTKGLNQIVSRYMLYLYQCIYINYIPSPLMFLSLYYMVLFTYLVPEPKTEPGKEDYEMNC